MASRKRKRSSKGTHSNQSGTSVKVIAPEDYNETIARAIRHLEAELASKIAWLPSGALTRTIRELSTSMNQIVQREQPKVPCRFLDLPAELRVRIYELVLESPKPFTVAHRRSGYDVTNPTSQKNKLALVLVCRQVSRECLPVFYGSNLFVARYGRVYDEDPLASGSIGGLSKWLRAIGNANCSLLKNIEVEFYWAWSEQEKAFYLDDCESRVAEGVLKIRETGRKSWEDYRK